METWEVDRLSIDGTVAAIRERVKDTPVYISINMCVRDANAVTSSILPLLQEQARLLVEDCVSMTDVVHRASSARLFDSWKASAWSDVRLWK